MQLTKETYSQIVQKVWDDPKLKKELLSSPTETIEKLSGEKLNLSQGKKLVVCDQSDETTVYFNIPRKPSGDTELTEEQLEAVAGGAVGPIKWPPPIFPEGCL